MINGIKLLFKSRRALLALAGIIAAVSNGIFGKVISDEIVMSCLGLIGLVVFGIAWEDAALKKNVENKE